MAKFKKIAKIIGGTALVALGVTVIKKLYDDYRIFNDFDVEDINDDEDKELDLDSFGNNIFSEDDSICEDEDEDDCEFDDGDIEEEFSDDEYSAEEDEFWEEDDEEYEEEYSEPSDSEEYKEPSDFEKVTKATREDAIKFILSKDKTYSDLLLADLSDQALAEIYVSLL